MVSLVFLLEQNISRKKLRSLALGVNLFIICPTNFDTLYGKVVYGVNNNWDFMLNHSVVTSFETYLWTFAVYVFLFMLGLVITMIYFRLNKLGKIVVSSIPFIIIIVLDNIPKHNFDKIVEFIGNIFGINNKNPYMAILIFIIMSILLIAMQYLLIRNAVADKN
ncbi:hypothetical protein FDF31_12255 [Clostridium sporogenes]|nr:hypothetical protein [Clostridium sporogenes]NFS26371.1 hypothetical protein [Clostridium sporogenes]